MVFCSRRLSLGKYPFVFSFLKKDVLSKNCKNALNTPSTFFFSFSIQKPKKSLPNSVNSCVRRHGCTERVLFLQKRNIIWHRNKKGFSDSLVLPLKNENTFKNWHLCERKGNYTTDFFSFHYRNRGFKTTS